MKDYLLSVFSVLRFIYSHSRIKINRSNSDFFADRIVQSSTEPTILAFVERLSKLMDTDIGSIWESRGVEFLKISGIEETARIYQWIRKYPRIVAMICVLPQNRQVEEALESITIDEINKDDGKALPQGDFDIGISLTMLSPLAHGSDAKAGNATLFRRMQILSDTGAILNLPFYAGNALRGEMRDLLADHFLSSMGIEPRKDKPGVSLWFFHAFYAGGALEEDSKAAKALGASMGANGAIKAEGIYKFRDTLPALSLLGCALGNRILCGRVKFGDMRPACYEWNNGETKVGQLFTWEYLTRREDHEGHEDGDNASMIANTECLKAGTVLYGGIDTDTHISDMERSALGRGLALLSEKGVIGAESRRGFGRVSAEFKNAPDPKLYDDYLVNNKDKIMSYLAELGALCTL